MAKYMPYADVAVAQQATAVVGTRLQKTNTRSRRMNTIWLYIGRRPKKSGLAADHAQEVALSEVEINIIIVLAIYFAINLAILWLVHILTKKYNDK